ncbi:MAG: response regulator transcription factor [Acidimicrobiales bacterium]
MPRPISVFVFAHDPLTQAGLTAELRGRPEIAIVAPSGLDTAAVAVVAADDMGATTASTVRAIQRNGCPRVVVVLGHLDDDAVLAAVEAGASGILRRSEASPERLVEAISATGRGEGLVPSDLLGRLLEQVGRTQRQVLGPRGLSFRALSEREAQVLRLMADGMDTAEVASQLAYSERTVKNVLYGVTTRLQLRNRTHAVAFAVREGLI